MIVGVPAEVKPGEQRVALTPDGVRELVGSGQRVLVERGAGRGSALGDDLYAAAGAELVGAEDAWSADLVVKVKEPQESELAYLRPGLTLFTYLHLAAYPKVAARLLESGATAIAYETVQLPDGRLPLLAPMSEIAGRLATQVGARLLEAEHGTKGVLLGGALGVEPARVVVIGCGVVGWSAARVAAGMDAEVVVIDRNAERLYEVDQVRRGRVLTLASNRGAIERALADADLVIGAVLVPGRRAPVVVTKEMVAAMPEGSVIVDVAVDQGGCVETTHETTHDNPTYTVDGVLHYAVGNMPAAVPHTSTLALTNATLPYVVAVALHGAREAAVLDPALRRGVNVAASSVTHPEVAEALGTAYRDPIDALAA
jgi:alanine dehydrogenase